MAYLGSFSTGLNITSKFPCTTYGDFIIRKSLDEGKCDFTVQHNLAEFQKRPGLVPMLAGFPIPAFHPAKYGIHGVFERYEKIQEETKNRNLICSELSEVSWNLFFFEKQGEKFLTDMFFYLDLTESRKHYF